jgi:hypothetical protein
MLCLKPAGFARKAAHEFRRYVLRAVGGLLQNAFDQQLGILARIKRPFAVKVGDVLSATSKLHSWKKRRLFLIPVSRRVEIAIHLPRSGPFSWGIE